MSETDPSEETALICTVTQRFLESVRTAGDATASMRKVVRDLIREDRSRYAKLTPQRAYRCLQLAFAQGFLQFFPPGNHRLQTWLETRFGHLDSVTVVDSVELPHLATAAARRLQRLLVGLARGRPAEQPIVLGVGGGHTVHEVLARLELDARDEATGRPLLPPLVLVGLTSGFDPADCSTTPNYLLGMLARKFPGRVRQCGLFAPGLIDRRAMADVRSWPGTREAVGHKDRLDVILSGLGSAADEGSVFWKFVRERQRSAAGTAPQPQRPVGDMLFGPFNAFGEPVELDPDIEMLAIVGLAELRRFVAEGRTRVVTVVGRRDPGHPGKAESLLAALRGEFFDTLIVDVATARAVQELEGRA